MPISCAGFTADVQVVPFEISKLPEDPGATKLTADVPFPRTTLLAVKVERPVPPSATAKSVIPVIEPPVMLTLLAFWVDIVPSEPVAAVIAAVVNAVVASWVVFVPGAAVGPDGAPVNVVVPVTARVLDRVVAPVKDVVPVTAKLPLTVKLPTEPDKAL